MMTDLSRKCALAHAFLSSIPFFSPRAEGMVRLFCTTQRLFPLQAFFFVRVLICRRWEQFTRSASPQAFFFRPIAPHAKNVLAFFSLQVIYSYGLCWCLVYLHRARPLRIRLELLPFSPREDEAGLKQLEAGLKKLVYRVRARVSGSQRDQNSLLQWSFDGAP